MFESSSSVLGTSSLVFIFTSFIEVFHLPTKECLKVIKIVITILASTAWCDVAVLLGSGVVWCSSATWQWRGVAVLFGSGVV